MSKQKSTSLFCHAPIDVRLWRRVDKNGPTFAHMDSACWVWTGHVIADGYGHIKRGKTMVLTHRLSWELTFGEIKDGLLVLHKCDNPPCCNPLHLFLGTHQENMKDMVIKGRVGKLYGDENSSRKYPQNRPRGEKTHGAKLTTGKVQEMRSVFDAGGISITGLGALFNMSRAQTGKVVKRESWTHVQ